MLLWNQIVDVLRESMLAYAQICNGNLGAGILAVTFLARLALLPLGLRMARAVDRQRSLGPLIEAPVVIALYSSVRQVSALGGRFLWIRTLARPDWPLALIATALTLLAAGTGAAPSPNRSLMLAISAMVTVAVLSKMAAGVGLYWALSSLFGAAQSWAVQRALRRSAA